MSRSMKYYRNKKEPTQTLLDYLSASFRYHTAAEWKSAIDEGRVSLNSQQRVDPDTLLNQGDCLEYRPVQAAEPAIDTEHIEILHEDAETLVVAKNGNIPVAPGGRYTSNTLLATLEKRQSATDEEELSSKRPRGESSASGGSRRPQLFLVHRIDKETSGIVVLAKSSSTAAILTRQFAEHVEEAKGDDAATIKNEVKKVYTAIVDGVMPLNQTVVVNERVGFHRDRADATPTQFPKLKMAVFPADSLVGKVSSSIVRCVAVDPDAKISVVSVVPLTGRTHQIRLHCAHLGFPIVGDKLYQTRTPGIAGGSFAVDDELFLAQARETQLVRHPAIGLVKRHLLHATLLSISLPPPNSRDGGDGEARRMTFVSLPSKWFAQDCDGLSHAKGICKGLDDAAIEIR